MVNPKIINGNFQDFFIRKRFRHKKYVCMLSHQVLFCDRKNVLFSSCILFWLNL